MAHSHCMEPGAMGLYIMPLTVHTTRSLGMGQGTGPGTNGLQSLLMVLVAFSVCEPLRLSTKTSLDD